MPMGREFYLDRIRRFTTIEISPEELHQTGVNENARIRSEMELIKQKVDFDGTLDEFLEHLRTDPRFYAKSAEELMQTTALILKLQMAVYLNCLDTCRESHTDCVKFQPTWHRKQRQPTIGLQRPMALVVVFTT